jgi:hypothetical protein
MHPDSTDRCPYSSVATSPRKDGVEMKKASVVVIVVVVALLIGMSMLACTSESTLSSGTPVPNAWGASYINDVVALQNGPGVDIYFTVCNEKGQLVKANGSVGLSILDGGSECYSDSRAVYENDFQDTKVGLGAFAHDTRLWQFARIPYSK